MLDVLMLDEYYKLRGWDKLGIPTDKKIKGLGLENYRKDTWIRRIMKPGIEMWRF